MIPIKISDDIFYPFDGGLLFFYDKIIPQFLALNIIYKTNQANCLSCRVFPYKS